MATHTVVGGQFGSEAKGHVAHQIITEATKQHKPAVAVRVGGPNAGHTACLPDGTPVALRTLPVGAVTPGVLCIIAQGSEIDIEVLASEVELIESYGLDIRSRLIIDSHATVITADHIAQENGGDLNARTGSTAKGIGAARADRLWRTAPIVRDDNRFTKYAMTIEDTTHRLNNLAHAPQVCTVIEGTQGYGLGLHTRFYPQTTSGNCRSVDLLAQCGIHPAFDMGGLHTWVVYRTYPIRVAGNSGPLHHETTWEQLQEKNPNIPVERTTVTKKVRRVGEWDSTLAMESWRANGGHLNQNTHAAMMFADYVSPELANASGYLQDEDYINTLMLDRIRLLLETFNGRAGMVGTSPSTVLFNKEITL